MECRTVPAQPLDFLWLPRDLSLAEELQKARERLRAAREVTRRKMDGRAAALDREAVEWESRGEEQRRLVAELMRLIGIPEVYTPVESLRSREERKRREAGCCDGAFRFQGFYLNGYTCGVMLERIHAVRIQGQLPDALL